jgi:hypothetical protein
MLTLETASTWPVKTSRATAQAQQVAILAVSEARRTMASGAS